VSSRSGRDAGNDVSAGLSRAVTPEAPADTRDMAEEAVYPPKMMPLKCAFKR